MNSKCMKYIALIAVFNGSILNITQANELVANTDNPSSVLIDKTQSAGEQSLDAKQILMAKLSNLEFFSAKFDQEVLSESGEILEQSSGKLAISRPNLANWHTTEPDELAIISDGQDVWFYNPWIEQVSVYSLSAAIAKTPILLLTSKDETLWQQYNVTKQREINDQVTKSDEVTDNNDESYVISAKDVNSQIKSLTLIFDSSTKTNNLKQFSFLDATGQSSHIKLNSFNDHNAPKPSLFHFVIPEGVQIDDQRAN